MTLAHRFVNGGVIGRYDASANDIKGQTPLYRAGMDPEWLKDELAKPGRSQSAAARYVGFGSPSQMNRVVKGERQLKDYEAEKIREYLRVTAQAGETVSNVVRLPKQSPVDTATLVKTRFIPVLGTVEAGAWREVFPDPEPERMPVPDSRVFDGEDVFALRVVGTSMNESYPDGTLVICRRWNGGTLPVGKDVVVERVDAAGKVETTLKELAATAEGLELRPRSNDPRHQEPIRFDPADEREVRVIGRVIWKMQPVD